MASLYLVPTRPKRESLWLLSRNFFESFNSSLPKTEHPTDDYMCMVTFYDMTSFMTLLDGSGADEISFELERGLARCDQSHQSLTHRDNYIIHIYAINRLVRLFSSPNRSSFGLTRSSRAPYASIHETKLARSRVVRPRTNTERTLLRCHRQTTRQYGSWLGIIQMR